MRLCRFGFESCRLLFSWPQLPPLMHCRSL
nr:MAG TPA: hypothetical protein [Caudoviricetes sp.]